MRTIHIKNRFGQIRTVNLPAGKDPFSLMQDGETLVVPQAFMDDDSNLKLGYADTADDSDNARADAYLDYCRRTQDAWRHDASPATADTAASAYASYCRRVSDAWRGAR